MVRKDCPNCGLSNYRENEKVEFICSYCKTNLNHQQILSVF